MTEEIPWEALRQEMVEVIRAHARGLVRENGPLVVSERVLSAMGRVPRERFVPEDVRPFAYLDSPLPIGHGKTISQPFITALMTELLDLQPGHRVLEVGTGLGYHAAVLGSLAEGVWSVEILSELAEQAQMNLATLPMPNVVLRVGDGARGWEEHAPYDRISIGVACDHLPGDLVDQLRPGGLLVAPLGEEETQILAVVRKSETGELEGEGILPVRFAPMVRSH